jgi:hypothetical protein
MDSITYNDKGNAVSFNGRGAVDVYRAAVIASALTVYARTGMKVNRTYTPKNMVAAAREILGDRAKGVGARDYLKFATLLSAHVESEKARIASEQVKGASNDVSNVQR